MTATPSPDELVERLERWVNIFPQQIPSADLRAAAALIRELVGRETQTKQHLRAIEGEAKLGVLLSLDVHGGKFYESFDDVPALGLWPIGAIKYSLILDRVKEALGGNQ